MKVRLKALKRLGRTMPGDVFYRGRTDANVLVALRVAELAPESTETQEETGKRRRSYRRRDMTPEE